MSRPLTAALCAAFAMLFALGVAAAYIGNDFLAGIVAGALMAYAFLLIAAKLAR